MSETLLNYTEASTARTTSSQSVSLVSNVNLAFVEVSVNLTVLTGGTTPNIRVRLEQQDSNGNWQKIGEQAAIQSATGLDNFNVLNRFTGAPLRFAWTVTGTPATCSFQVSLVGKGSPADPW